MESPRVAASEWPPNAFIESRAVAESPRAHVDVPARRFRLYPLDASAAIRLEWPRRHAQERSCRDGGDVTEQDDRETQRAAIGRKRVTYHMPGSDALPMPRGLVYRAASGTELLMDVYLPSASEAPPPVVVLPMAYPDPAARVRAYGPSTSWARLLAASGMAAVIYGPEAPAADIHAVLQHLRANADPLGLDLDRIGLLASSANVTVGLSALMRDRHLTCAAFLYGYTMDLGGSTAVADASAQFGFANACAGRSVDDLPTDTPMLFVRAGRDAFPGLNAALDELVRQAVGRNLPVSLVNHATGAHGFDLDDRSPEGWRVVEQVLWFLQRGTGPQRGNCATLDAKF